MKEFKVIKLSQNGRETSYVGNLQMQEENFAYTLRIAYEAKKIKKMSGFKTASQFFTALNKAFDYKEESCYAKTNLRMEM
jgi:hypothetical protein